MALNLTFSAIQANNLLYDFRRFLPMPTALNNETKDFLCSLSNFVDENLSAQEHNEENEKQLKALLFEMLKPTL